MSRAFVREVDDRPDEALEKPQSPWTNYVTPRGLRLLQERVRELQAGLQALPGRTEPGSEAARRPLERELRYYTERVKRAVLVEPDRQPLDRVHFGALVEVEDVDDGERLRFTLVGEDEADVAVGLISWVSPLARALMNAEPGDVVEWKRPAGNRSLEIVAIGRGVT